MSEKDGGRAFPYTSAIGDKSVDGGMTLRDYFAAAALTGLYGNDTILAGYQAIAKKEGGDMRAAVAVSAYGVADAMLAERSK